MRYEIIEGDRAFLAFESDYRSLYELTQADNPFNSPDWIYTWYAYHQDQGAPYVIAVYSDAGRKPLCAFPLFRVKDEQRFAQSRCVLPMAYDGADYQGPLVADTNPGVGDCLTGGIGELLDSRQCWLLIPQMPAASARWMCDALLRRGMLCVEKRASLCPYIQLQATLPDFMRARFNSRTRQMFRRKLRRLGDCGEVSIEVARSGEELSATLPVVADIEAQSWKGENNIGLFSSPRRKRFYIAALKKLALDGKARISVLTLAGTAIAYEIGLLSPSRYMAYGLGYLPQYQQYSPGSQLMLGNIEYAIDSGYQMYDFMSGEETYKSRWATHSVRNRAISVFNSTLLGCISYQATRNYNWLKSLARSLVRGA